MADSTADRKRSGDGRRSLGLFGEELAVAHLQSLGYTIVERNFRARSGEIDIVAEDRDTLVFVEVRTRSRTDTGHPLESVNHRKQRQVIAMARYYLLKRQVPQSRPCRFDVIAVVPEGEHWHVELIRNAFSA